MSKFRTLVDEVDEAIRKWVAAPLEFGRRQARAEYEKILLANHLRQSGMYERL
jgi:hypothetical protein